MYILRKEIEITVKRQNSTFDGIKYKINELHMKSKKNAESDCR